MLGCKNIIDKKDKKIPSALIWAEGFSPIHRNKRFNSRGDDSCYTMFCFRSYPVSFWRFFR